MAWREKAALNGYLAVRVNSTYISAIVAARFTLKAAVEKTVSECDLNFVAGKSDKTSVSGISVDGAGDDG